MFKKRREFVEKVMEIANIEGFKNADEIAQAVIKIFQVSIGEVLSKEISESVPPDLSEGWNLIWKRDTWGTIDTVAKRKDFVKKVMEITGIKELQRADEIAQVVLKLLQLTIDESLSKKIAESVSEDLRKGWERIEEREWKALDFRNRDVVSEVIP